jgi:hypothetical protein
MMCLLESPTFISIERSLITVAETYDIYSQGNQPTTEFMDSRVLPLWAREAREAPTGYQLHDMLFSLTVDRVTWRSFLFLFH